MTARKVAPVLPRRATLHPLNAWEGPRAFSPMCGNDRCYENRAQDGLLVMDDGTVLSEVMLSWSASAWREGQRVGVVNEAFHMDLSPNRKLLAVVTRAVRVMVFDVNRARDSGSSTTLWPVVADFVVEGGEGLCEPRVWFLSNTEVLVRYTGKLDPYSRVGRRPGEDVKGDVVRCDIMSGKMVRGVEASLTLECMHVHPDTGLILARKQTSYSTGHLAVYAPSNLKQPVREIARARVLPNGLLSWAAGKDSFVYKQYEGDLNLMSMTAKKPTPLPCPPRPDLDIAAMATSADLALLVGVFKAKARFHYDYDPTRHDDSPKPITVSAWSLITAELILTVDLSLPGPFHGMALSPNGKLLVVDVNPTKHHRDITHKHHLFGLEVEG